MYEIITKEQIPEYEAFVQSHPKGNFAQSWLWSKPEADVGLGRRRRAR